MISANGGLPAHRYTPQVTQRWPRGSEPASVDGGEAGLHSPLLAELQLFVCVICAAYFSAAPRDCTNRPHLPTCKAKADVLGFRLRNQDYLHVLYACQVAL